MAPSDAQPVLASFDAVADGVPAKAVIPVTQQNIPTVNKNIKPQRAVRKIALIQLRQPFCPFECFIAV
jgi:hypothetical protein